MAPLALCNLLSPEPCAQNFCTCCHNNSPVTLGKLTKGYMKDYWKVILEKQAKTSLPFNLQALPAYHDSSPQASVRFLA